MDDGKAPSGKALGISEGRVLWWLLSGFLVNR
uniref:Uncharacterized protein n=1 Tax=Onchocerca volvulus TaxID=6282 RepID=A0A8R1TSF2_ONCVO